MTGDAAVRAAAEAWLAADPDPETQAELVGLLAAAETDPAVEVGLAAGGDLSARPDVSAGAELAARFAGRLQFGTAGLRAPLGAGPARMNRVVVRQATAAVMATLPPGARVVVAHDARRNSDVFAADAAALVAAAGGEALLAGQVPTPVAAHAVLDRAAQAGIVITASHNPPGDNGYKLYGADGIQIVPPRDAEVEAHMAAAPLPPARLPDPAPGGAVHQIGPEATQRYLAAITRRLRRPEPSDPDPHPAAGEVVGACGGGPGGAAFEVVYTPLHGVGAPLVLALFERLGLPAPAVVGSQAEPDGEFPTVAFPNPEEPGALDAALALADQRGADLVIANDPDADRLAVAVPTPGGRRRLTGDELGALLADHLLDRHAAAAASGAGGPVLVATSVVSSQMLRAIAADAGVAYAEVLTGFKWIARAAEGRPERLLFGYEEALGYAVCDEVRDKDGISAAALLVQLALALGAEGRSLLDRLDDLARRHGVHATAQVTVGFPPAEAASGPAAATDRLRRNPPRSIAGQEVAEVTDYLAAAERDVLSADSRGKAGAAVTDYLAESGPLPATDMLAFALGGRDRVIVRPSGTEPKLKVYVETVEPVRHDYLPTARRHAAHRLDRITQAMRALVTPAPS